MADLHPDSAAIDRVGLPVIRDYFQISRQAAHYWRKAGVPKRHRRSLAELGERLGHNMKEMRQMRDRHVPNTTPGRAPASSALPA